MLGLPDAIQAELLARRLPNGCWSWLANGCQAALEPTCLALLGLSGAGRSPDPQPLIERQMDDGSWPAFDTDTEASGLTGLALITLTAFGIEDVYTRRAQNWLLHARGRESQWPWRWKFRTLDTRVRFDPQKFGWPWQPATCSWVVPTAFSVLALKQTVASRRTRKLTFRIRRGVEMLLDRACPGGGWNAGNGVVYGRAMAPHIDATAIALLALKGEPTSTITESSVRWLERTARSCFAPWSLAWAILAVDVHGCAADPLRRRLSNVVSPVSELNNATLAVTALALDCATATNPFEVHA